MSQSEDPQAVELSPELRRWVEEHVWWIHVCTEPGGQNCASGTHPNILRHECAALRRWHEAMAAGKSPNEPVAEPGPKVVRVPVRPRFAWARSTSPCAVPSSVSQSEHVPTDAGADVVRGSFQPRLFAHPSRERSLVR